MTLFGYRQFFSRIACLAAAWGFALGGSTRADAHNGFDTALGASAFIQQMARGDAPAFPRGTWLRVRGLGRVSAVERIQERAALQEMRARGYRICALLEWAPESWTKGVRDGGGYRLPVDLSEAFERARDLGAAFAGFVDVWEIGNEPDVSFIEENPETYAAYLRTCRLGLIEGAMVAGKEKPRVLMAPLALPPGPYFERLWANGVAAETDGVNFHFYGYAEDFSGVWLQWRNAVEEENGRGVEKTFPVFMTEYGYGLLSPSAALTKKGRLRQWRWFYDVGRQMRVVWPEAAMAFVLGPYLEEQQSEFGLLQEDRVIGSRSQNYTAADFPRIAKQPWMEAIGGPLGKWRVSPALSWFLAGGAGQEEPKSGPWQSRVVTKRASVVLDFIARDGLEQRKGFLGYFARGFAFEPAVTGWGEIVVYNFGRDAVEGTLALSGDALSMADGGRQAKLLIPARERQIVRVRVRVSAKEFCQHIAGATFSIDGQEGGRCVMTFWPDPTPMEAVVVNSFSQGGGATTHAVEQLIMRSLAIGEPALRREGRWLLSKGTTVLEDGDSWLFKVADMPDEPSRPAMAELPLPETFRFPEGTLLEFEHRLVKGTDSEAWFDVYFRTQNGNLYQVWPRAHTGQEWQGYAEAAENFTMAFYGRAELPWRFRENRPVALVFFLRPQRCPAVFEIKGAAITRRLASD